MQDITTGLYTYLTGNNNALTTQIGGRFYKELAVQGVNFPYIVYHIISDVPEYTWNYVLENVRIQFDLVSKSYSTAEVETMYTNMRNLLDWCTFTISNNTFVTMKRMSARLNNEQATGVFIYNVDYMMLVKTP